CDQNKQQKRVISVKTQAWQVVSVQIDFGFLDEVFHIGSRQIALVHLLIAMQVEILVRNNRVVMPASTAFKHWIFFPLALDDDWKLQLRRPRWRPVPATQQTFWERLFALHVFFHI